MELFPWITLAVVTLSAASTPGGDLLAKIWRGFDRLAANRFAAPLLVALIALLLGVVPILTAHAPVPSVHDEFANLLAADTFVHGRLTNPTPDLWEHFETVHELMRPTYASKFPPGEGLTLAAGMLLGCAALGAVGTIALGCAMTVVALRCWMPLRWAMLGGLLAATHPMIFQWGQSYWGGGVGMLGGALLMAGVGRAVRRRADLMTGILIGAGLAIFAISRPFEGLIVAIVLALVVIVRSARRRTLAPLFTRVVPGMLIVLLPAGAWLGYYNHRVTGHWSRLPWVEYASQYMTTPIFFGQSPPANVTFRNDKMRQFHAGYEQQEYARAAEGSYFGRLASASQELWKSWTRPTTIVLLAPAALFVLALRRARGARLGAAMFLLLLLLHPALTPWMRPQYLAPATSGFMLWMVAALRRTSRWGRFGAALAAGIVAAHLVAALLVTAQFATRDRPPGMRREEIVRQLEAQPGRQLVLVRYTPGPQSIFEWVYNGADLNAQQVIFARSLDPGSDAKLIERYSGRNVWLLVVDELRVDGPIPMPR